MSKEYEFAISAALCHAKCSVAHSVERFKMYMFYINDHIMVCIKKLPFSKYIEMICEHLLFIGRLVSQSFSPRFANIFFFAPGQFSFYGLNCLTSSFDIQEV